MNKNHFFASLIICLCIFSSCAKKAEAIMPYCDSATVSVDSTGVSSAAAIESSGDKTHQFIRTANLNFRVKNVISSTYHIENVCMKSGGFVTSSKIATNILKVTSSGYSSDSLLENTEYEVSGSLTLRVPNTKLDTVLRQIATEIDFLNTREIEAEEVSARILSNKMSKNRSEQTKSRLTKAIDKHGRKLEEIMNAEEQRATQQEQTDQSAIHAMQLNDQISYSTISISMSQRSAYKQELILNPNSLGKYKPGIVTTLLDDIKTGWSMLVSVFHFLLSIWTILLLAFVGVVWYRRRMKKQE